MYHRFSLLIGKVVGCSRALCYFHINPRSYFQNGNNIRIMPFHLRAVWNAARNKKAPEYRDVINTSLLYVRVYRCRKEEKCNENGANRAAFPEAW